MKVRNRGNKEIPLVRGQWRWREDTPCPRSGAARRSHLAPEAKGGDPESHPELEANGGSWEETATPEARAGGWEENQGVVAAGTGGRRGAITR